MTFATGLDYGNSESWTPSEIEVVYCDSALIKWIWQQLHSTPSIKSDSIRNMAAGLVVRA